jgi:cytochrome c biogenesis protein CcdA
MGRGLVHSLQGPSQCLCVGASGSRLFLSLRSERKDGDICNLAYWGNPDEGGSFIASFFEVGFALLILGLVITLYFLPSIVAYNKKKKNREAIGILNLLLGWTIVGWIASLVWAATED